MILHLDRINPGLSSLVIIAALSLWLVFRIAPDSETQAKPQAGNLDYFSVNMERVTLNETGGVKDRLFTAKLEHFVSDDHIDLERPVMTFYSQESGAVPWQISGDRGVLHHDGTITLLDTALINREANEAGRSVRIITSNLLINPELMQAQTDDHIEMLSPPDEMSGDGARIHYGNPLTVTLLSNVRRIHYAK